MDGRVTRRALTASLFGVAAAPLWANAPATSLRPVLRGGEKTPPQITSVQRIISRANLSADVGFVVMPLGDDAPLEEYGGQSGIPPASVAKALTAVYALETLGPSHRFTTQVVATGPVIDGVLLGDLVLGGGGDPLLDTTDLAGLASQVKASGLREIKGRLLYWESSLPIIDRLDPDQPEHVGYNPTISGLALNFNRVHFEWKRAAKGTYATTLQARSEGYRPAVDVAQMTVVDRQVPVYTYASKPKVDEWTVAKQALGNGGSRWLPTRLPGLYAGDVFRTLLRSHGIVTPEPKRADWEITGRAIARHQSAPLDQILRGMLKYSNNLTAEMVGMAASVKRRGHVSSLRDSAVEMSAWAKANFRFDQSIFVDHSGLNEESSVTAHDMCRALIGAQNSGLRPLLKPFQMRDSQGRPNPNHPVQVQAKTGTLHFVSGLAGYISAPGGREMAFAIFAANRNERAKLTKATRDRPPGARSWNRRAKNMQQALIERWNALYRS